jgi:hypothetical protein
MGGAGRRLQETTTIHRISKATIRRVVYVRKQEGWCHEAIAAYLNQENINVSSGSAYHILKRNGLITKPYKPRRQRTYIRFQREHPDCLRQTDIKYYDDLFVGLDVHKNYLQAAVVDAKGQPVKQEKIENSRDDIASFFQQFENAKVVIESSSTWYSIYQLLSERY